MEMKSLNKWSFTMPGGDVSRIGSLPISLEQGNILSFPTIISKGSDPPLTDANYLEFERTSMRRFYRIAVVSQSMLLCALLALLILMSVMGTRMSNNMTYYYNLAEPVIIELTNHSIDIMRHADSSAAAVDRMAAHTEKVSDISLESLVDSVNRTAAAVTAATEIVKRPVMRIGIEAAS